MRRELHLNKAVNIIADALLTPYSIRQSLWFDWDVCDGMAVASHLDEQRRLTLTPEAGKRRTNSKGTFRKGQREECEGPSSALLPASAIILRSSRSAHGLWVTGSMFVASIFTYPWGTPCVMN